MKRYALLLLMIPAAACTTMGKLKEQESATAAQKSRADGLDAQLAALKTAHAATVEAGLKVSTDLKAASDQLAAAQTSNKDLQQALDAKKGELTQKVSDLIKQRDALSAMNSEQSARIAALEKKAAAADAARAAAEAEKAAEVEKVRKNYEDLTSGLKSEIAAGEIKITQLQGKLTVNLVDRILFDSGKAEVKDDGRRVLDKVGGVLNTVLDKNIRIEGHTDNKPITGELQSKYPTNWELSTARATAVARYQQDKAKVDPTRLVAAGYGEFHPVASNDTLESRALNRRIEIVLVPKD
ncbi:MAG: OmpA family protein [Elusimicrobiota bacterium]